MTGFVLQSHIWYFLLGVCRSDGSVVTGLVVSWLDLTHNTTNSPHLFSLLATVTVHCRRVVEDEDVQNDVPAGEETSRGEFNPRYSHSAS